MITKWTSTEDIIISIIKPHTSFDNTIDQHDIAAEFMFIREEHMTPRRVRRVIESLIKEGYPIISTPKGGYCYGGKDLEALQCYRRLRRQGIRILLRARNVLRNNRIGQQRLLFDITDQ